MAGFAAGVIGGVGALMGDKGPVDMGVLGTLQAGAGALGVASKVPQIWTVWRNGGTGQLSAFAVGFGWGGFWGGRERAYG